MTKYFLHIVTQVLKLSEEEEGSKAVLMDYLAWLTGDEYKHPMVAEA